MDSLNSRQGYLPRDVRAMAEEITTSTVSYESGGEEVTGYLARPASGGPHPGMIVIQEWWGVDGHIKDLAERFAREGYAALAPDLYTYAGHRVTKDADEAAKLAEELRYDTAMRYLRGGVEYLKESGVAVADRVGVVGYCLGGSYALLMSCQDTGIGAAAAYYGQIVNEEPTENNPVNPIEMVPQMSCPLLFVHAGLDEWITLDHADRLREAMASAGKEGEVKSYPNAQHAFFNDTQPDIYNEEDARDAWDRTLKFFKKHLAV